MTDGVLWACPACMNVVATLSVGNTPDECPACGFEDVNESDLAFTRLGGVSR